MSLVPARSDRSDLMVSPTEWNVMRDQAKVLVDSGFLPQSVKRPEQAIAIMLKGRELGVPPMQAFAQINVIQGKPAIGSELMLALIFRNVPGAKVEFERYEADGCTLIATRPGHKPARFSFNASDADAAQLTGKDNWKKYPRAMYRSRAISEMARSVFPDAIMGCSYTPEELGATVNEDGEVIDVPATPAPAATAPHQKAEETQPEPRNEAEPKRFGYTGSQQHQEILKKALVSRKVDESLWDEIDAKMLGKSFNELQGVLDEVVGK